MTKETTYRRVGGNGVLVAVDERESLLETAHLLKSEKNAERLLTALSRARGHSLNA